MVTSMTDREAQNHSMPELPKRAVRYKKADEFAEVMNQLFDSWSTDNYQPDKENITITKNHDIQPFNHNGDNFQVKGPLTLPSGKEIKQVQMHAVLTKEDDAHTAK